MKNTHSLVVAVSNIKDIAKIKENTKYINIDITNYDHDVIDYFIKNGENYLYSDIIENTKGYVYVTYEEFLKAENIINLIYANMPEDLNELEIAKYLYIAIGKCVCFDINVNKEKNENYNIYLMNGVNNLWGSLSQGRVTDISVAKIYYYLCKRLDIKVSLVANYETKEALNHLEINNQILNVDLFSDIPYIWAKMHTRNFATYNEDIELDKKIKYIRSKYNDYHIDKSLKNIDYTKENCLKEILYKTQTIIEIDKIKPVELSIIYNHIFTKYCPNYDIKINNLFLNNKLKKHFIMISYNNTHYSYNYKHKSFVKVNNIDILNNLENGKIGLYLNELIPNLEI